jgi:anhydro-N-acetylmuramic acid kinase
MDTRLIVGLSSDEGEGEIRAALVRVGGVGLDSVVECLATATVATDRTTSLGIRSAASADDSLESNTGAAGFRIAQRFFDAVRAVTERAAAPLEQILLIGFKGDPHSSIEAQSALVAARLAELSGATAVGGFTVRDRAAGGRGGPITPLVDWILANDARNSRLVTHIDGATSLTVLPAASGLATVAAFDAGPGTILLEELAATLTRNPIQVDARGVLAVQGRQIKPLVRRWAAHPFLRQQPPKFLHGDDFAGPFIDETVRTTVERGWSVADVLCTATHFLAACPADAVRQFLIKDHRIDQVVLVGRGTQNGFLLRLLEEQFTSLGISTVALPKIVPEAYDAVTAAVLACLAIDGVPSSLPSITGAAGPRRLGTIVPGSPQNWRLCVEWMHRTVKPLAIRAA